MDRLKKRAIRRYKRYVKGIRRIREDRATHTYDVTKPVDDWCLCFLKGTKQENGRIFSKYADYPANCNCIDCTSPRELTRQERRAPEKDEEW